MSSRLFEILKVLEQRKIGFFNERDRSDGLTITAVLVGTVDEDDMVDVAVLRETNRSKSAWTPCSRRSKKTNRSQRDSVTPHAHDAASGVRQADALTSAQV